MCRTKDKKDCCCKDCVNDCNNSILIINILFLIINFVLLIIKEYSIENVILLEIIYIVNGIIACVCLICLTVIKLKRIAVKKECQTEDSFDLIEKVIESKIKNNN